MKQLTPQLLVFFFFESDYYDVSIDAKPSWQIHNYDDNCELKILTVVPVCS